MYFAFEQDFVASLRCIPMVVRFKLDQVGLKVSLSAWQQLSLVQREALATLGCSTPSEKNAYHLFVTYRVTAASGVEPKAMEIVEPWLTPIPPPLVVQQAHPYGSELTVQQWHDLAALQRFVLIKLVRSCHDHRNFQLALQEFGLG